MSDRWIKVPTQLPGVDLAREAREALAQQLEAIRRTAAAAVPLVHNPAAASPGAEPDGIEGALILIEDIRAQAALSMAILEALQGGNIHESLRGDEPLVRPKPGAIEFDPWFQSVHLQERTLELLEEVHRDRPSSLVPEPTGR
jgi:hypothetical protein